jgi:hypothetical protein
MRRDDSRKMLDLSLAICPALRLALRSRTRRRGFLKSALFRPSRSSSHQKARPSIATQQAQGRRPFPHDRCHGGFSDQKTTLAGDTAAHLSSLFQPRSGRVGAAKDRALDPPSRCMAASRVVMPNRAVRPGKPWFDREGRARTVSGSVLLSGRLGVVNAACRVGAVARV